MTLKETEVSQDPPIRLTPYFTIKGCDEFIQFMSDVFDARLVKINRYDDGTVQHARLKINDSLIMLNEANGDYLPNLSQMHIYVDNVSDIYQLALNHGAVSLMTPMIRPHGDWMAGFKDPFGNIWWIAEDSSSL